MSNGSQGVLFFLAEEGLLFLLGLCGLGGFFFLGLFLFGLLDLFGLGLFLGADDKRGTDNQGHPVASGIFFYKLESPGFSQMNKMTLLK